MTAMTSSAALSKARQATADAEFSDRLTDIEAGRWASIEKALAAVGVVIIAARVDLRYLLTVGDLLALALLPLWLPVLRRYRAAWPLLAIGVVALVTGTGLMAAHSDDHKITLGGYLTASILLTSLLVSFGFLLWARERLRTGTLSALFGFGLLLGLPVGNPLFPTNPWKYGISFAVSVLALGLAQLAGRRGLELLIVAALAAAAAINDFRSGFVFLALVGALLLWQGRPTARTRKGSAARTLLAVLLVTTVVYNVAHALILAGGFGEETRARSIRQLDTAGSLLLGGRPELAATVALMRDSPLGFGPGVFPSHHDTAVAKAGMLAINYDPDNGYVDRWMFGRGNIGLHSTIGDLWVQFGLAGLALVVVIVVVMLRQLSRSLADRAASGLVLLLTVSVAWALFFEPFYSTLTKIILLMALSVQRKPGELHDERSAPDPVPE